LGRFITFWSQTLHLELCEFLRTVQFCRHRFCRPAGQTVKQPILGVFNYHISQQLSHSVLTTVSMHCSLSVFINNILSKTQTCTYMLLTYYGSPFVLNRVLFHLTQGKTRHNTLVRKSKLVTDLCNMTSVS